MYDDVEDTDEEPDVDDIEVNAEVGYTIKCACTQMLKGQFHKICAAYIGIGGIKIEDEPRH
jgi:hypothetical protein